MERSKLAIVMMALLALGVIVLVGCGGSSKRLTREQYAAKADAICAALNKQVDAAGAPQTAAAILAATEKLLPYDRKTMDDLKKLKPPANEEKTVQKIITLNTAQVNRIVEIIAALKNNDIAKATVLGNESAANKTARRALYQQLGVTECASN